MNLQFLNPPENGLLPTDSHFKVPLYTFVCVCTTLIYIKREDRKALQLLVSLEISTKKRPCSGLLVLAEDGMNERKLILPIFQGLPSLFGITRRLSTHYIDSALAQ